LPSNSKFKSLSKPSSEISAKGKGDLEGPLAYDFGQIVWCLDKSCGAPKSAIEGGAGLAGAAEV
jgi:hypothetical protein